MAVDFDSKLDMRISDEVLDEEGVDGHEATATDRRDMMRLGKTQELNRNFRLTSIWGFAMIAQSSWEAVLMLASIGLVDGGMAGLVWIYFVAWVGFSFVNVSMAEMGSMAPTSGGQYHWVSEFAPPKHQKFLSYLMGWLSVLGWQVACASTAYISGTTIQGLVVINYPGYVYENWHGTLIAIAVALFSVLFNTVLARKLPLIEGVVLIIHIFAFIGILVTLWVLSPLTDPKKVFTEFTDLGGWGSLGASALVGITGGMAPLLGADASVHMAEEVQDASRTIPKAMLLTTAVNGAMGWIMTITMCFCMGDVDSVLTTPTGYPFIQIFLNSTKSTAATTGLSALIIWSCIFSNLATVACASRQLYAFSRDKGVPFHSWFASVNSYGWDVPLNAVLTTFIISALLSLINIGSPVTLNSITSLATVAGMCSYITSIGCMVWRRMTKSALLPAKFSLGKWGLPVNIISLVFLSVFFVFAFFPVANNPDLPDMNWSIVMWGGVIVLSLVYYHVKGKYEYVGPVEYVRKLQ